jgi:hypothetical protein
MLISKLTFGFIKAPNYSWRVGADAEEAVGRELEKLPPGWFVRHDIFIGKRWNVDHIIVGPPGVFLFDTKFRSGIVKTTRDGIRVNNRRTDMAEKVQDQAREASGQFRDAGLRTWVQPVLVFDNDIRGTRQPDGVHVVGLARVIEYLKALPPELEDAEVQRLGRVLLDDATWPFTPQSDDDAVFYEVPKQRWKWAALATAGAALGALLIGAATLRGPTAPPSPPPESIQAISARYKAVGATQYKLKKVTKEVTGVSSEPSTLVGYYDGVALKKSEWTIAGELNEMMFHNGRLEFAFKKKGDSERRFYLVDGKLIAASEGKDRKLVETSGAEVFDLERRVLGALNTAGDRLSYDGGKFVAK